MGFADRLGTAITLSMSMVPLRVVALQDAPPLDCQEDQRYPSGVAAGFD